MLARGLPPVGAGLPVREGAPEDNPRESDLSLDFFAFFAATALANRSANRSFVLLLVDAVREGTTSLLH